MLKQKPRANHANGSRFLLDAIIVQPPPKTVPDASRTNQNPILPSLRQRAKGNPYPIEVIDNLVMLPDIELLGNSQLGII